MSKSEIYQASFAMPDKDLKLVQKQLKSWRLMALLCLVVVLVQCGLIAYIVTSQTEYVYVAKVKAGESIQNVVPVGQSVTPNEKEKLAFARGYISRLMTLSLDPVVVRSNWMENYDFSGASAKKYLSHFIQSNNLVDNIGKKSQQMYIRTFNKLSGNSYQFTWDTQSYDDQGKKIKKQSWSGVFTLSVKSGKRSGMSELINPFDLQVESFSLNKLGG